MLLSLPKSPQLNHFPPRTHCCVLSFTPSSPFSFQFLNTYSSAFCLFTNITKRTTRKKRLSAVQLPVPHRTLHISSANNEHQSQLSGLPVRYGRHAGCAPKTFTRSTDSGVRLTFDGLWPIGWVVISRQHCSCELGLRHLVAKAQHGSHQSQSSVPRRAAARLSEEVVQRKGPRAHPGQFRTTELHIRPLERFSLSGFAVRVGRSQVLCVPLMYNRKKQFKKPESLKKTSSATANSCRRRA